MTISPDQQREPSSPRQRRAVAGAVRPLRLLLVASVLVPLALFTFAALESYHRLFDDAEELVRANAAILREHALKVFETQNLVVQEVDARLAGLAREEIDGSRALHLMLASLGRDLDQINSIWLIDRAGDVMVSSVAHPPPPPPDVGDPAFLQAGLEMGSGVLIDGPFDGGFAGDRVYSLSKRVTTAGGTFDGSVVVAASLGYFSDYHANFIQQAGQTVVLVRQDRVVLARTPPIEGAADALDPQSRLRSEIGRGSDGVYVSRYHVDGLERITGYQKIGEYPVYIAFGLSTDSVLEQWRAIVGTYAVITLIAVIALFLTTRSALMRTRDALALQGMLRRSNEALERRVGERTSDLSAANDSLQAANAALRLAVAERELLLREIHHRVKNNLQVIISLLNLQAHAAGPPLMAAFNESLRRIRTMARIHEMIYSSSDITGIDFAAYLHQLCGELIEFYGISGRVSCRVQAEHLRFDLDTATPFAMVVNEVLANACKHAFPGDERGEISIDLWLREQRVWLTLQDDGVGLPSEFGSSPRRSMGMRLIETLSSRLNADFAFETADPATGRGTVFRLSFDHPDGAVDDEVA